MGSDLQKWHAASIDELAKIIFHEILQKEQERSTLRIFDESVQLSFLLENILVEFKSQRQTTDPGHQHTPKAQYLAPIYQELNEDDQQEKYEQILSRMRTRYAAEGHPRDPESSVENLALKQYSSVGASSIGSVGQAS